MRLVFELLLLPKEAPPWC